jgi:hypothetical protein
MGHVHIQLSVWQLLQVAYGNAAISVCAVSWDVFAGVAHSQACVEARGGFPAAKATATFEKLWLLGVLLLLLDGWACE